MDNQHNVTQMRQLDTFKQKRTSVAALDHAQHTFGLAYGGYQRRALAKQARKRRRVYNMNSIAMSTHERSTSAPLYLTWASVHQLLG